MEKRQQFRGCCLFYWAKKLRGYGGMRTISLFFCKISVNTTFSSVEGCSGFCYNIGDDNTAALPLLPLMKAENPWLSGSFVHRCVPRRWGKGGKVSSDGVVLSPSFSIGFYRWGRLLAVSRLLGFTLFAVALLQAATKRVFYFDI